MQFDDILKEVGEFGKFQKIKYGLLCLLAITNAFQALISVFSIYTPKHRYVKYWTYPMSINLWCALAIWPGRVLLLKACRSTQWVKYQQKNTPCSSLSRFYSSYRVSLTFLNIPPPLQLSSL